MSKPNASATIEVLISSLVRLVATELSRAMKSVIVVGQQAVATTDAAIQRHVNSRIMPSVTIQMKIVAEIVNSLPPVPFAARVLDSAIRKRSVRGLRPIAPMIRQSRMGKTAAVASSAPADSAHRETSSARQSWAAIPQITTLMPAITTIAC